MMENIKLIFYKSWKSYDDFYNHVIIQLLSIYYIISMIENFIIIFTKIESVMHDF